jgi:hypothetical protein
MKVFYSASRLWTDERGPCADRYKAEIFVGWMAFTRLGRVRGPGKF